jgi:hypothetical protein
VQSVLVIRDAVGQGRKETKLEDGTVVVQLSDDGVKVLRNILSSTIGIVRDKMLTAERKRWMQRMNVMRLVSKQFASAVDWYASVNDMTKGIRSVRARQRTIQEFFPVAKVDKEQLFLIKGKHYIDEYGWSEPGDSPVGLEEYVYTAEEFDDQSCGNEVLDSRAFMDSDTLLQDLKVRYGERLQKEAAARRRVLLEEEPQRPEERYAASIWDSIDEESDDSDESEDDVIPGLRDLDGSFESVSGSDSEYWAAVEDPDLSDALIDSTDDSSSQDFH